MNSDREYTPQERAMVVAWNLAVGVPLTVKAVVRLTGLKARAARRLLVRACRVLPVFKDGDVWRKL